MVKPLQNWGYDNFFHKMLGMQNFGHMTTSTTWLESRDKLLMVRSWTEIIISKPFLQNIFILTSTGVAIFADIIKIVTIFVKTIFKGS